MRCLDDGHTFELDNLDGSDISKQTLVFVKRFRGAENHPGTWNQEVLRALIHRVIMLDQEMPWAGNDEILFHLRRALVLHENRALLRKLEKGELRPELIEVDPRDGHFVRIEKQ